LDKGQAFGRRRNWYHTGFSVHNEVVINENDREAMFRLAQYVVHASFSPEKTNAARGKRKKLGLENLKIINDAPDKKKTDFISV
jgi:hypothetical protein